MRPVIQIRGPELSLHIQILQIDIGTRAIVHRLFCIVSQFEGLVNEVYSALHNRRESAKVQAQQLVAILYPWLQWAQVYIVSYCIVLKDGSKTGYWTCHLERLCFFVNVMLVALVSDLYQSLIAH